MSLEVRLLEASHTFEVSENGNVIASGEQAMWPAGGLVGMSLAGTWLPRQPYPAFRPFCLPPTGKVHQWKDPNPKLFNSQDGLDPANPADPTAGFRLAQRDVYKLLRLHGYDYGPHFQGILEASLEGGA